MMQSGNRCAKVVLHVCNIKCFVQVDENLLKCRNIGK